MDIWPSYRLAYIYGEDILAAQRGKERHVLSESLSVRPSVTLCLSCHIRESHRNGSRYHMCFEP